MKRTEKILLLLAVLALIITAAPLVASASDDGISVSDAHILFEDGALYYTYDVPKSEVTSGDELRLYCYEGIDDIDDEPSKVSELVSEKTVDGIEYYVLYSPAILPQNVRRPLIARVAELGADGEVKALSEVVSASFFEKTIDIIDSGIGDQTSLFVKLLDFGAAMQRVLEASGAYTALDLQLSGGYADEYCKVVYDTYLDGELYGQKTVYYTEGEWIDLYAEKSLSGAIFAGFTNGDGEKLLEFGENTSPTHNKYNNIMTERGTTVYTLSYENATGKVTTFDTYTSVSQYNVSIEGCNTKYAEPSKTMLKVDKNGVASTTVIANGAYAALNTRKDEKYLTFNKIISVLADTTYPEGYEGDVSGAYKTGDIIKNTTVNNTGIYLTNNGGEVEDVLCHVFEADLMINAGIGETPTQLWLQSDGHGLLFGFEVYVNSKSSLTLTVNGGREDGVIINDGIALRPSDWFNIRIEYYPLLDDSIEVKVYLNGQYTGRVFTAAFTDSVTEGAKDEGYIGVYAYHLNGIKNATLSIDNLLVCSMPKEN